MMMTSANSRLSQLALVAVGVAITSGVIIHPVIAQDSKPDETIRVKLDVSGSQNEWIRIERRGNVLKLIHTKQLRKKRGVEGVLNTALGVVGVGGTGLAFYDWDDHQTVRSLFKPDRCFRKPVNPSTQSTRENPGSSTSRSPLSTNQPIQPDHALNCLVVGTDTLVMPTEADIRQGQFTIEYKERDLLRSVTFRITD